ncbi:MAG TPA: hypothetical protein VJI97_02785 [Candidatus Nanoarchaeia archaeon]|nr:hypothetical protein [Candidatus Nanoarchaeia archaeon]
MGTPAQTTQAQAKPNSTTPTFSIRDLIDATVILETIFSETGYWVDTPDKRSKFLRTMGTGEYRGLVYQLDDIGHAMKGLPEELMPTEPKPHYSSGHFAANRLIH